jgi:predicted ribosomally synthesized peptide with SipW-like signal peptide
MARSVESRRPRASLRVRAALAGGLVLGVSAGLTVASWTDAEYTSASFTASSFGMQSSVNAAAFTTSATLNASVSGLYPSATLTSGNAYVSLRVKTTASSVAGQVRLSAAAATGSLAPVLRYRIVQAATCNAAAFTGSPAYVVGGASSYQAASSALSPTAALSLAAAAGTGRDFCIEFSIPTGTSQATYGGASAVVPFTVSGSST